MPSRRRNPDPGQQELPEFPPAVTAGTEKWLTEYIEISNDSIMCMDYLVRDGIVTSERRERVLTDAEVTALYASGQKRTFDATCDHISSLAN